MSKNYIEKLEQSYITNISSVFRYCILDNDINVDYYQSPYFKKLCITSCLKINDKNIFLQSVNKQIYEQKYEVICGYIGYNKTLITEIYHINMDNSLALDDYMKIIKMNLYFSNLLQNINMFYNKYNICMNDIIPKVLYRE